MTAKYNLEDASIDVHHRGKSIWQFKELLPPVSEQNIVSLGEGWTPYVLAENYGASIGVKNLWCKLEGQNPTGAFKDRIGSLGLSLVKEWGKKGVFLASSGNAAAAVSAYSARAEVPCLVLIREDSTASKLGQISMYGAKLLRVRDLFKTEQSLFDVLSMTQRALPDWLNHFVWVTFNPLLIDSMKTIAYEIASSPVPDYVFVPTAGGDLLYGIFKGFCELKTLDIIDRIPKLVVVQGKEASPTVQAVQSGSTLVPHTGKAQTVAGALRVNFGAEHSLVAVRESHGFGVALSDDEIIAAEREIAKREGIFCEVSSATSLAGIAKAVQEGKIARDESACAILTGVGFKEYYPSFTEISEVPLATKYEDIPQILKSSYGL
ncbi:MAG: pyridoxal-phosphate dependent enzyme [Nitrososphaerota archaeon]|nr:pyridoxal-phosphate dependent enzyme [Nitrososphaerota archaeon]